MALRNGIALFSKRLTDDMIVGLKWLLEQDQLPIWYFVNIQVSTQIGCVSLVPCKESCMLENYRVGIFAVILFLNYMHMRTDSTSR